jgi:hypothetical protein
MACSDICSGRLGAKETGRGAPSLRIPAKAESAWERPASTFPYRCRPCDKIDVMLANEYHFSRLNDGKRTGVGLCRGLEVKSKTAEAQLGCSDLRLWSCVIRTAHWLKSPEIFPERFYFVCNPSMYSFRFATRCCTSLWCPWLMCQNREPQTGISFEPCAGSASGVSADNRADTH